MSENFEKTNTVVASILEANGRERVADENFGALFSPIIEEIKYSTDVVAGAVIRWSSTRLHRRESVVDAWIPLAEPAQVQEVVQPSPANRWLDNLARVAPKNDSPETQAPLSRKRLGLAIFRSARRAVILGVVGAGADAIQNSTGINGVIIHTVATGLFTAGSIAMAGSKYEVKGVNGKKVTDPKAIRHESYNRATQAVEAQTRDGFWGVWDRLRANITGQNAIGKIFIENLTIENGSNPVDVLARFGLGFDAQGRLIDQQTQTGDHVEQILTQINTRDQNALALQRGGLPILVNHAMLGFPLLNVSPDHVANERARQTLVSFTLAMMANFGKYQPREMETISTDAVGRYEKVYTQCEKVLKGREKWGKALGALARYATATIATAGVNFVSEPLQAREITGRIVDMVRQTAGSLNLPGHLSTELSNLREITPDAIRGIASRLRPPRLDQRLFNTENVAIALNQMGLSAEQFRLLGDGGDRWISSLQIGVHEMMANPQLQGQLEVNVSTLANKLGYSYQEVLSAMLYNRIPLTLDSGAYLNLTPQITAGVNELRGIASQQASVGPDQKALFDKLLSTANILRYPVGASDPSPEVLTQIQALENLATTVQQLQNQRVYPGTDFARSIMTRISTSVIWDVTSKILGWRSGHRQRPNVSQIQAIAPISPAERQRRVVAQAQAQARAAQAQPRQAAQPGQQAWPGQQGVQQGQLQPAQQVDPDQARMWADQLFASRSSQVNPHQPADQAPQQHDANAQAGSASDQAPGVGSADGGRDVGDKNSAQNTGSSGQKDSAWTPGTGSRMWERDRFYHDSDPSFEDVYESLFGNRRGDRSQGRPNSDWQTRAQNSRGPETSSPQEFLLPQEGTKSEMRALALNLAQSQDFEQKWQRLLSTVGSSDLSGDTLENLRFGVGIAFANHEYGSDKELAMRLGRMAAELNNLYSEDPRIRQRIQEMKDARRMEKISSNDEQNFTQSNETNEALELNSGLAESSIDFSDQPTSNDASAQRDNPAGNAPADSQVSSPDLDETVTGDENPEA